MNGRRTIQSGGVNREYILRVPDDYDNTRPYRLVLAYHWRFGTAEQVANGGLGGSTEDPYYGLWDLAESSTIFVALEGLDAGWVNTGGRDVAFTDAILEEVLVDLCIDTTRIFATGFSFGAAMSHALACSRPDVFRGVALYAGAQLSGCDGGTTPHRVFSRTAWPIRSSAFPVRPTASRPLRGPQRLHSAEPAGAGTIQRHAHLRFVRRLLGRASRALVCARRGSQSHREGSRPKRELGLRSSPSLGALLTNRKP
jgi:hypothetical protein